MSKLKIELPLEAAESFQILARAVNDGYSRDYALGDLQCVYLLGQLRATKSIQSSYPTNSARLRIKAIERELVALGSMEQPSKGEE